MQFQFDFASANATPPVAPQQPGDATVDLLRQLVELMRDNAAQQRDTLAQILAVQQEHLNQVRAAAQDAQARWRNLLARWQSEHPEFANFCRQAYPLLEKAYVGRRDSGHDQTLIGDTLADLDAVLRMFTALTRISQIEANDRTAGFRPVDLADIAREVVELFDAAAEEKGGHLGVVADQHVLVIGDRDVLFDAVANLVDNAIKHGREAGAVTVEVTQGDGSGVISVADDGPGIPPDECQHVFSIPCVDAR